MIEFCILFVIIYYISLLFVATSEGHLMHNLYSDLMTHYEKDVRPSATHDDTLNVTFAFSLAQIIDVDEKNQILTTNTWINQGWFDSNLKWNPKLYGNISTIHVPNNKIWLPDIVLYNNADSHYKKAIVSTDVYVKWDGNVTWLTAAIFKSSCEMNVRYYPFDEQVCYLKFASWSYDGSLVNLMSNKIGDYSNYIPSTEWDLLCLSLEEIHENFSCCPDEFFPVVRVTIRLKRKPMFYVFNFILPCILISSLSLFGFYMPSNSGEKVTLGITTLLSITVFMLLVAETMPPTSRSLPLIGTYYIATLMLVSLTTLCTVITLNIHHKGEHGYRLPRCIKIFVFKYLAPILFLKPDPPIFAEELCIYGPCKRLKPRSIDQNCNNNSKKSNNQKRIPLEAIKQNNNKRIVDAEVNKGGSFQDDFFAQYLDILQKLYSTIEKAQKRQHKKVKNEIVKREWQQLALVVDKFLLIVFICVTVVASFLIIYQKELISS